MRAGKTIVVALAVLVAAAVATVWLAPPVAAAGQQTATITKQAEKQQQSSTGDNQAEKKIERQVIVKKQGTGPETITIIDKDGQGKVMTHALGAEPMIAALAGGGPRLGVQIRDITTEDVAKLKLAGPNGVIVDEVVKESAAEKAGVKAGDIVVQFDGESVRSAQQFTRLVRETVAGRTVKMAVLRDGKRMELSAAPAMASDTFNIKIDDEKMKEMEKQLGEAGEKIRQFHWQGRTPMPVPVPEGGVMQFFGDRGTGNFFFSTGRGRLGVTVQDLTPELAGYFGVKDGLLVNSVQADSPAAKAGIKAGDVIGTVNGKAVTASAELIKELADKDGEVTIGVTRDKKPLSLKATLEERKQQLRRKIVVGNPA
jgi:serine protease Do